MSVLPRGAVCMFGALRSPFVNLSAVRPDVLLSRLLRAFIDRTSGAGAAASSFFLGCAHPEGIMGWNLARQALCFADLPMVSGSVTSSLALSGIDALAASTGSILLQGGLSLAGAISQPSRVPYGGLAPEQAISYELMSRQATWPRALARQELLTDLQASPEEIAALQARTGKISVFTSEDLPTEEHPMPNPDAAVLLLLGREHALRQRPWCSVRGVVKVAGAARTAPLRMVEAAHALLASQQLRMSHIDRWLVVDSEPLLALSVAKHLALPVSGLLAATNTRAQEPVDSLHQLAEAAFLLAHGELNRVVVCSWSEGGQASAILLEAM
jgi:hypothetical protein